MSAALAACRLPALLAGLALLCAHPVALPGQATGQERRPSVDSARLTSTLDSIRVAIGATGASAAVIFPDGRLWAGTSGEAWSETPVTPVTVFDVGSITKSYTAALVIRFVERGVLALDDSLSRWFPDLPGSQGVRVVDLLRQTSGLADYASHPEFLPAIRSRMAGPWPPEENLRFVGDPLFAPGERWGYSNTNYLLLGLIVAQAAERPLAELLREHVFDPLNLTSTYVAGEDDIPAPRAHAYLDFTGDGQPDDLSALVPDPALTRGAGGAGAVVATAADVARFARAYYTGAITASELREAMMHWVERGDGWKYGFGMIVAPHGSDLLFGHLGNTAGHSAGVWHARDAGITVSILTNVHAVRMADPVRTLLDAAVHLAPALENRGRNR